MRTTRVTLHDVRRSPTRRSRGLLRKSRGVRGVRSTHGYHGSRARPGRVGPERDGRGRRQAPVSRVERHRTRQESPGAVLRPRAHQARARSRAIEAAPQAAERQGASREGCRQGQGQGQARRRGGEKKEEERGYEEADSGQAQGRIGQAAEETKEGKANLPRRAPLYGPSTERRAPQRGTRKLRGRRRR